MVFLKAFLPLCHLIFTQKAQFLWENTAKTFVYVDYINTNITRHHEEVE